MKNEIPEDIFKDLNAAVQLMLLCASPHSKVEITVDDELMKLSDGSDGGMSGKEAFMVAATALITMSGKAPKDFGIDIKMSGLGIQ
jgi:hypothetical protein